MKIDVSNTVFVFDLDDTLYKEIDYCYSGFSYVSNVVMEIYGVDIYEKIINLFEDGEKEIFGKICLDLGLPAEIKESLVWVYRTHFPSIDLLPSVREIIENLKLQSAGVCILTDGRSLTQRLKMKALGIGHLHNYISEEYSDIKPGLKRYELIQHHYPGNKYVYIADNPKKDFIGPNILGWFSVGIKGDVGNIHLQNFDKEKIESQPSVWIRTYLKIESINKYLLK